MNPTKYPFQSLGKSKAIALSRTGWWQQRTAREIAKFQLFTQELCLPFGEFHKALEEALGRPVFTHELGYNRDGLIQELMGEKDAPTPREIMDLIPEHKRLLMRIPEPE
jgi:hypothetical protein